MKDDLKKERGLLEELVKRGDKISKAERIKILIKIQKGLVRKYKGMVDFKEPILFLKRRNGDLEFYDNVTQGKFVFTHSDGGERWIEIRPQDQLKFNYGDKRVRCYLGDEDRPFTGQSNSALDSESVMMAVNKINSTKMKYEESLAREKRKKMATWVKIILAIAGAIVIIIFGLGTWGQPILEKIGSSGAKKVVDTSPKLGLVLLSFANRKVFNDRGISK